MRIFMTGATGQVGRRLTAARSEDDLVVLTRDARRAAERLGERVTIVEGDPTRPGDWQQRIDGCDAVVHLAGASVADRRWTRAYKQMLVDSRVETTRQVVAAIAAASRRPPVLINASAVGYYGDRGDTPLDESATAGDDFLARLAVQWEGEAAKAADHDVRVVLLRSGVVLDADGGALAKMVSVFRFGLGGPLGSGRQYLPWIHHRDAVGLIGLALEDTELSGPLNVVAPQAVTNRQFARALGRVLHRPAVLPTPVAALRVVLGEFGAYAAVSQRVVPEKATRHGFDFAYPVVEPALEDLLS